MRTTKTWVAALGLMAIVGASQAALVNRGGGMIYDTVNNITWLADMNYAFTSGYAAGGLSTLSPNGTVIWTNGRMGWGDANAWANNLVYGGYSDWRLPTLNPQDTTCSSSFIPSNSSVGLQYSGTGCTGGELSHLFVTDLGNKANESVLNQLGDTAEQIANLALFSNVQSLAYWSGTEFAAGPQVRAWVLRSTTGEQLVAEKIVGAYYALAVRLGDVAAAAPEPQTLALVLLALGATMVARRRRPG